VYLPSRYLPSRSKAGGSGFSKSRWANIPSTPLRIWASAPGPSPATADVRLPNPTSPSRSPTATSGSNSSVYGSSAGHGESPTPGARRIIEERRSGGASARPTAVAAPCGVARHDRLLDIEPVENFDQVGQRGARPSAARRKPGGSNRIVLALPGSRETTHPKSRSRPPPGCSITTATPSVQRCSAQTTPPSPATISCVSP
jgi:hypothetical protein